MTARESIIDYIDAKVAKLKDQADRGLPGWAMAKHDARMLEVLRNDILNEFDMKDAGDE